VYFLRAPPRGARAGGGGGGVSPLPSSIAAVRRGTLQSSPEQ